MNLDFMMSLTKTIRWSDAFFLSTCFFNYTKLLWVQVLFNHSHLASK